MAVVFYFLIVISILFSYANAFKFQLHGNSLSRSSSHFAFQQKNIPQLQKLNSNSLLRMSDIAAGAADVPIPIPTSVNVPKVEDKKDLFRTLRLGVLFGLWYALNIGYNIYNKKVLNAAPALTWTVAWIQLVLGLFFVFPIWVLKLRKTPELTFEEIKTLIPVSILHMLTHYGAIISLGAGAVSFTHIVKAAEPAVSAFLSAAFLQQYLPLPVYLSLIPVMGGVAMASLTELSFSWLSFWGAMLSNVASAGRGIVGKLTMGKSIGKNMDSANLYAVMSLISAILVLPFTIFIDRATLIPTIQAMMKAGTFKQVFTHALLSCLFYYSYNEIAFLALDSVAPVTHALANTIKRVVIIITSVLVFGNAFTLQGAIGSAIAIFGVLLYSLAKNHYK